MGEKNANKCGLTQSSVYVGLWYSGILITHVMCNINKCMYWFSVSDWGHEWFSESLSLSLWVCAPLHEYSSYLDSSEHFSNILRRRKKGREGVERTKGKERKEREREGERDRETETARGHEPVCSLSLGHGFQTNQCEETINDTLLCDTLTLIISLTNSASSASFWASSSPLKKKKKEKVKKKGKRSKYKWSHLFSLFREHKKMYFLKIFIADLGHWTKNAGSFFLPEQISFFSSSSFSLPTKHIIANAVLTNRAQCEPSKQLPDN